MTWLSGQAAALASMKARVSAIVASVRSRPATKRASTSGRLASCAVAASLSAPDFLAGDAPAADRAEQPPRARHHALAGDDERRALLEAGDDVVPGTIHVGAARAVAAGDRQVEELPEQRAEFDSALNELVVREGDRKDYAGPALRLVGALFGQFLHLPIAGPA